MNIMSCFMVTCLWLCHVVHPYHFLSSLMAPFYVSFDVHSCISCHASFVIYLGG